MIVGTLAASGLGILVFLMSRIAPVAYLRLVMEDQWVEYATAILFFACATLSFWTALKSPRGLQRLSWAAMGLAAVYVSGEEVSWGQRIFGYPTPSFMMELNRQGELTLHNLYVLDSDPMHLPVILIIGGWLLISLIAGLAPASARNRALSKGLIIIPPAAFAWFAMTVFLWIREPVPRAREIAEFFLGASTAAVAVDGFLRATHSRWLGRSGRLPAYAMLASLVLAASVALPLITGSWHDLNGFLHRGAAFSYPEIRMYDQANSVFEYIYDNPQLQRKHTRILHGRMLIGAGRQTEAVATLNKALAELTDGQPDSPEAWLYIGVTLSLLGQEEDARSALARCNELIDRPDHLPLAWQIAGGKSWWKARTALAGGNRTAALQYARAAHDEAVHPRFARQLEQWIETAESGRYFLPASFQDWVEFAVEAK